MDWLVNDAPKVRTAYGSKSTYGSSRPKLATILPITINSSSKTHENVKQSTIGSSLHSLFDQENAGIHPLPAVTSVVTNVSQMSNSVRERIEFDDIILQQESERKTQKKYTDSHGIMQKDKEDPVNRAHRSRRRPLLKSIIAQGLHALSTRPSNDNGAGANGSVPSKLIMEKVKCANVATTVPGMGSKGIATATKENVTSSRVTAVGEDFLNANPVDGTDVVSVRSQRKDKSSNLANAILTLGCTQPPLHSTQSTTSISSIMFTSHTQQTKVEGNLTPGGFARRTSLHSESSRNDSEDEVPFDLGSELAPSVQSGRKSLALLHSAAAGAEIQASRTLSHLSHAYRRLSIAPRQRSSILPVAYGKNQNIYRLDRKLSLAPSYFNRDITDKASTDVSVLSPRGRMFSTLSAGIGLRTPPSVAKSLPTVSSPPALVNSLSPTFDNASPLPYSNKEDSACLTSNTQAHTMTQFSIDNTALNTKETSEDSIYDRVWKQCLEPILEFLPSKDLLLTLPQVCKRWETSCSSVYAWRVASNLDKISSIRNILGDENNVEGDNTMNKATDSSPQPTESAVATLPSSTRARKSNRLTRDQHVDSNSLVSTGQIPLSRANSTMDNGSESSFSCSSRTQESSSPNEPLPVWLPYLRQFPWGKYLASGAYKAVYSVWNSTKREYEATSIMDVKAIAGTGNLSIVSAEVQVGCLLSKLTRDDVCPNFLEIRQTLLMTYSPEVHFPLHWNHRDEEREEEEEMSKLETIEDTDGGLQSNEMKSLLNPSSSLNAAVEATKDKCPYDQRLHSLAVAEKVIKARKQISQQRMDRKKQWLYPTNSASRLSHTTKPTSLSRTNTVAVDHEEMAMCPERIEQAKLCIARSQATISSHPPTLNYEGREIPKGVYLYTRMELCQGGNVEDWLAKVENLILEIEMDACRMLDLASWEHQYHKLDAMKEMCNGIALGFGGKRQSDLRTLRGMRRLSIELNGVPNRPSLHNDPHNSISTAVMDLWIVDYCTLKFARDIFFQICFALFVAQDRLHLRHFDIKLLNVFLQPARVYLKATPSTACPDSVLDTLLYQYAWRQNTYHIHLHSSQNRCSTSNETTEDLIVPEKLTSATVQLLEGFVAKLADFGTASTCPDAVHTPIEPHHFTTFENCAPEMLCAGNKAKQGYAIDHWALGLSLLHLLTGATPYEEVMQNVTCPEPLKALLGEVWSYKLRPSMWKRKIQGKANLKSYEIVRNNAIECIVEADNESVIILADTLWRYLVLLGPPPSSLLRQSGMGLYHLLHACTFSNKEGVKDANALVSKGVPRVSSRLHKNQRNAPHDGNKFPKAMPIELQQHPLVDFFSAEEWRILQEEYLMRHKEFGLRIGSHPLMVRLRRRCFFDAGALELLEGFLDWDVSTRMSVEKALDSSFFLALTESGHYPYSVDVDKCSKDYYEPIDKVKSLWNFLRSVHKGKTVVKYFAQYAEQE